MSKRDEKFIEFTGQFAFEGDGGWSKEVWDQAWNDAIETAAKTIDNFKSLGDTAASFAIVVRQTKE